VKENFPRLFRALMLAFFGMVMVQIGYETLRRGNIKFIRQDGPAEILSPDHGAAAFWALSAGMCAVGALLLLAAAYILLRVLRPTSRGGAARVSLRRFMSTSDSHWWAILNLALVLLSLWTGYAEMAPGKLAHSNPDIIFCTITLVTAIAFSFGAVRYSISGAGQQSLRRASWRRFSIDWWHDPLQCLFLSCCFTGAMAVGAALRLPGTTPTGFWMFMFFVCLFLGLLVGQLLVYSVHCERITNT